MACPWKFLFKTKFHQYAMNGEKDINNNVEKAPCATSSPVTQDDLQYHNLSKQQNESPQPLVETGKKSPESLVKLDATPLSSPRHVRIKNWGSGMTFQDTLHHKAKGGKNRGTSGQGGSGNKGDRNNRNLPTDGR
uniref:Nitric oxide synthase 2 n=1 Tax=Homo sapiens TaxID=9606 RepID=A0A8V8TLB1_HUMAN